MAQGKGATSSSVEYKGEAAPAAKLQGSVPSDEPIHTNLADETWAASSQASRCKIAPSLVEKPPAQPSRSPPFLPCIRATTCAALSATPLNTLMHTRECSATVHFSFVEKLKDPHELFRRVRKAPSHDRGIQPGPPPPHPKLTSSHSTGSTVLPSSDGFHGAHNHQQHPLGPYGSPTSSGHNISHHPPYLASIHGHGSHGHSDGLAYYAAQPSPYSTASTSGSYSAAETSDLMAAPQTMRSQMHHVYHTPQSNSPASLHSPPDAHSRQPYSSIPQQQHLYYPYNTSQTSSYLGHGIPMQQHHQQMSSHPSFGGPFQPTHHFQPPTTHAQDPSIHTSPRAKVPLTPSQRSSSQVGHPQISPNPSITTAGELPSNQHGASAAGHQGAAPGPIPATTPLVVSTDDSGVQWIAFEYSRDRVKVQYEIRCDVASVDTKQLSKEHKEQNCVYPRACKDKDSYKGNRLRYETECNEIGWALSHLNPILKGKRGLIQRAVDSWRNSNSDHRLRSRRVRRLNKNQKRNQAEQSRIGAPPVPTAAGSNHIPSTPTPRQTMSVPGTLQHHHQLKTENAGGHGHLETSSGVQGQALPGSMPHSASGARHAQSFHPVYPVSQQSTNVSTLPSTHENMDPLGVQRPSNATAIAASIPHSHERNELFNGLALGRISKLKRGKTISDFQNERNIRVSFRPEDTNLDEIPDAFRRITSVYPGSYYPRQCGRSQLLNFGDDEDVSSISTSTVPIQIPDGWQAQIPVPNLTSSRRRRECALNDLGSLLAHKKTKNLYAKPLLLQRALDTLRGDAADSFRNADPEPPIPSTIAQRPGKRNWSEHS